MWGIYYNSYIRHIHNESQRHIIVHTGLTTDFKSFHVQQVNHTWFTCVFKCFCLFWVSPAILKRSILYLRNELLLFSMLYYIFVNRVWTSCCFHADYFITEYLFSKKGYILQTGSKQELNYTYKICIMITLLTNFYSYLCIVKSFK